MSFPFGGFKTPGRKRKGRYSGATRDFEGEMMFDEGDGDRPYNEHLDMTRDPAKRAQFDECWHQRIMAPSTAPDGLKLWAVAQSHVDVAWLWRLYQSVNKARITCGKAAFHVLNLPEFKFTFSQPVLLDWLRRMHPTVFKQVKQAVKTGRFDLQGGDWVELDGKMPSGESFCRQRLYGQLFYREHFGKMAEVGWLPDSFGYNNNIPQLLSRSGCKYFYTQKISGNWPPNEFPFSHFKWRSPDGSEVVVYSNNFQFRPVTRWKLFGHTRRLLKPGESLECDYDTPDPTSSLSLGDPWCHIGIMFGVGDGGHGPTVEEVHRMRYFIEKGYVQGFLTAKQYFNLYEKEGILDRLPVWNGTELYYNLHRGTLTTQGLMKRMNRSLEWKLTSLQSLLALKAFCTNSPHAAFHKLLTRLWKDVLLLQFHDILPGSSIPEVYDDCYDMWLDITGEIDRLERHLLSIADETQQVTGNLPDHDIILANGNSFGGIFPVEIPIPRGVDLNPNEIITLKLAIAGNAFDNPGVDGNLVKNGTDNGEETGASLVHATMIAQVVDAADLGEPLLDQPRRLISCMNLSPWTIHEYRISELISRDTKGTQHGKFTIEETDSTVSIASGTMQLEISRLTGMITSCTDLKTGNALITGTSGIHAYRDWFLIERAWNIGPGYKQCPLESGDMVLESLEITEKGPVRSTVEIKHIFPESKSAIIQRVQLIDNIQGVFFETHIDWKQENTILKHEFHLSGKPEYSVAEAPYSTERVKADPSQRTKLGKERWESCCHTWIAHPMPGDNGTVFLVNDCKYGYDIDEDTIGLTLLRAPDPPKATGYAKLEREQREDAGPPSHADQEMHVIKYALLHHDGSWKDGIFQKFAHCFNSPPIAKLVLKNQEKVGAVKLVNFLPDAMVASPPNLEISAMKNPEVAATNSTELVIRVVENGRKKTQGTITFPRSMRVMDVKCQDLLERCCMKRMRLRKEDGVVVSCSTTWNPHEIVTLRLLKEPW
ncbi:hypothetical protein GF325_00130, partial [Candidatus Bathyarchaeota archaeon]|nr:hypothetical protein [Candidatus Bathyarchaeota archaeon]